MFSGARVPGIPCCKEISLTDSSPMQQPTSPAIGLCGSFAQRDALIPSVPLLFLHVLEKGGGVFVIMKDALLPLRN